MEYTTRKMEYTKNNIQARSGDGNDAGNNK